VAYGKANPGKLNYASAGVGTAPHLAAAMCQRTGIDAVHVPYKGSWEYSVCVRQLTCPCAKRPMALEEVARIGAASVL
jgi:tripartite-type tricarboxylate transporter receptor subunit TctC